MPATIWEFILKSYQTLVPLRKTGDMGKNTSISLGDHFENFIEAVRAHDKSILNGPVETAHHSSALAHLGNISYRLNRQLTFDADTEKFIGDEEADKMLTRKYRKPFVVPDKVWFRFYQQHLLLQFNE